ncbi:MAG: tetratricopeptide repeat protein, partial [Gemmataceae bacterium]
IMDGRTTLACVLGLFLAGAGCVHTNSSSTTPPPATPQASPAELSSLPQSTFPEDPAHGGKRLPKSSTVVAMAAMKEREAEKLEKDPDLQFKVRDQSRVLYQEALKLDEKNLDAYTGLIRIYAHQGDVAKAREMIQRGIATYPKEAGFWVESARIHNRSKQFPEAIRDLNKALELDPENRRAQTQLGLTMARMGQFDQAMPHLARSMGPATAHYTVARMMLHLNQDAAARQQLTAALHANPNHEGARDLLASLEGGNGVTQAAARPELQLVE